MTDEHDFALVSSLGPIVLTGTAYAVGQPVRRTTSELEVNIERQMIDDAEAPLVEL